MGIDKDATARQSISRDKSESQKGKEDREEIEKRLQKRAYDRSAELSPMLNYIYNLAHKDPATLSLTERQWMRLEDTIGQVGMKELMRMLAQRGLAMKDLSYDQIIQLTQRHGEAQVVAFLDELVKQKRAQQRAETAALTTGAAREAEEQPPRVEKMTETQETAEAERQLKRDEVIKQIVDSIEIRSLMEKTEVAIRLNPEYLGELFVKLDLSGDRVRARFQTTSREVRDVILKYGEELKAACKKKGRYMDELSDQMVEEID